MGYNYVSSCDGRLVLMGDSLQGRRSFYISVYMYK